MKPKKKKRDLTTIIEEAFEAGFLSMLGSYVLRTRRVEAAEETGTDESPSMLRQSGEISLS